jgi:8-oxo-dGTP pyrophosphatase MutT (NUDIX family)
MGRYKYNRYRDVEIDVSRLAFTNETEFVGLIQTEFSKWYDRLKYPRIQDTAVMWLSIPKDYARVVPWLLAFSPPFILHHANEHRIMMVRPANPSKRSQIPCYGSHYVKVEAVVVEENTGRVLIVQERIGSDTAVKSVTGSCEAGEFVSTAAEREVWEETKIKSKAISLIGVSNRIHTRFDRDEVTFGILLFAPEGQVPQADGFEVRSAAWSDIKEASATCTPMSREWLAAASASKGIDMPKVVGKDIYRGQGYCCEWYTPRA